MKGIVVVLVMLAVATTASAAGERVLITEFMAVNGGVVRDVDGDSSDWIEIYNAGVVPVNLAGWHLTDDPSAPGRWTFPATNLGPGAYLVVFASGKDRAVPGAELHANFQLEGAGEYLALVRPDFSIAHEFAPNFPEQESDLSYGVTISVTTNRLLGDAQPLRWQVPAQATKLLLEWAGTNFNDSTWNVGQSGFGFSSGISS